MRYMIREFAAGVNVSYESVSRDYSQSNYSSSRLALMDDRDTWRVLQNWYLQCFRSILHRQWLQTAVLAREIPNINLTEYGVNPEKYESVKWKPRGWSWIDPTKEVAAYREAEKAGYITKTQIIAQTGAGQDFADTMDERKRELEEIEDRGLSFETDTPSQSVQSMDDDSTPEDDDQPDDDDNRQMRLVK
jgi:lambda family phage portal protein